MFQSPVRYVTCVSHPTKECIVYRVLCIVYCEYCVSLNTKDGEPACVYHRLQKTSPWRSMSLLCDVSRTYLSLQRWWLSTSWHGWFGCEGGMVLTSGWALWRLLRNEWGWIDLTGGNSVMEIVVLCVASRGLWHWVIKSRKYEALLFRACLRVLNILLKIFLNFVFWIHNMVGFIMSKFV